VQIYVFYSFLTNKHDTTIDEKLLWSDIKVEGFCNARFDRRDVLSRQEREERPPFLIPQNTDQPVSVFLDQFISRSDLAPVHRKQFLHGMEFRQVCERVIIKSLFVVQRVLIKSINPWHAVLSLDLPYHLQKRINHFWIKLGPCQGANIFSNFVL